MQKKNIFYLLDTAFIAVSKYNFLLTKKGIKLSTKYRNTNVKTFLTQLVVGVSKNNLRKYIYLSLDIIETKMRFYY